MEASRLQEKPAPSHHNKGVNDGKIINERNYHLLRQCL